MTVRISLVGLTFMALAAILITASVKPGLRSHIEGPRFVSAP
jgi:hypothetical protein